MKTVAKTPAPKTAAANDTAAPDHFEVVTTAFVATLSGPARWVVEGWAAHLRTMQHPRHVANSHAKHAGEFGVVGAHAEALTVARMFVLGMGVEESTELLSERATARAMKRVP